MPDTRTSFSVPLPPFLHPSVGVLLLYFPKKSLARPPLLAASAAPAPPPPRLQHLLPGWWPQRPLVSALHHLPSGLCLHVGSDPVLPCSELPAGSQGLQSHGPAPRAQVLRDLLPAPGSRLPLQPHPLPCTLRLPVPWGARPLLNAVPSARKRAALLHPAALPHGACSAEGGLTSSLDRVGLVSPFPKRPRGCKGPGPIHLRSLGTSSRAWHLVSALSELPPS